MATQHTIVLAVVVATLGCLAHAQQQQYTTPVPILKQLNRHNDDGSYSYGYEAADGSFKIETKHPTGEVFGKYGYVDDTGKVREIEYGASKRGFEPVGTGIDVPPPTLNNNNYNQGGDDGDDGQYREDPSVYYKEYSSNKPKSVFNNQAHRFSNPPQQLQQQYNQPQQKAYVQPQQQYNPPQPRYNAPQQQYNPPQPRYNAPQQQYNQYQAAPQQRAYSAPQNDYRSPINVNLFRGHPATNFDVNTGSYSINYK